MEQFSTNVSRGTFILTLFHCIYRKTNDIFVVAVSRFGLRFEWNVHLAHFLDELVYRVYVKARRTFKLLKDRRIARLLLMFCFFRKQPGNVLLGLLDIIVT